MKKKSEAGSNAEPSKRGTRSAERGKEVRSPLSKQWQGSLAVFTRCGWFCEHSRAPFLRFFCGFLRVQVVDFAVNAALFRLIPY